MRWNAEADWVWSAGQTHEAIIDPDTFEAARRIRAAGTHRPSESKRRTTGRRYILSGLVSCGLCGRRMQGQPNHGSTYYRCRFPSEYALAARVDHPRTVYVQEGPIVTALDGWLARLFDAEHIDATCAVLAGASEVDEATAARRDAARRQLAECEARLAKYRSAIEAGAEPAVVAGWTRDVEGQRLAAQRTLAEAAHSALTHEEIKTLAGDAHRVVCRLTTADPTVKAELYRSLGVRATYLPESNEVDLVARPVACATERVGGGT